MVTLPDAELREPVIEILGELCTEFKKNTDIIEIYIEKKSHHTHKKQSLTSETYNTN